MSRLVNTTLDFNNIGRIANLPDPVNPQDPATMNWTLAQIEGLNWKDNVAVASTGNINLTSPGTTIDGVTMTAGMHFLAKDQTSALENGLYVWNGSAVAATRSLDANTSAEITNAIVTVDQGTANAGSTWRQTAASPTLGTTAIAWTPFGVTAPAATTSTPGIAALATQAEVNAGAVTNKIVTPQTLAGSSLLLKKYAASFGDGTSTSYAINHNLNTTDVQVEIFKSGSTMDTIITDIQRTSVNQVTVVCASAPATNSLRIVVIG